jgi:hypothetical protein
LVVALLSLHFILWATCYVVSALNGDISERLFFLSRAMSFDPSRAVANFFMPLIALVSLAIVVFRAVTISDRCTEKRPRLLLNLFLLGGYILSVGMVAVSAIPFSVWRLGHLIVAGVVFGTGITLTGLSCSIDHMTTPVTRIHIYRWVLFVVGLLVALASGATYYFHVETSAVCEIIGAAILVLFLVSIAQRDVIPVSAGAITPPLPEKAIIEP